MSNYELKILNLLNIAGIRFEREKTFSDLKHGKFRYDFFLPKQKIIIEVNGEQHYQHIKYFHKTRQSFLKAQENDRRKISYALANNYKIYCIPYWEMENIHSLSDILQKKFIAQNRWHNDIIWKEYQKNWVQ